MANWRSLITDVLGLAVGNAHDARLLSGVTVVLADRPFVAAVDVRGAAPGTRETDALSLMGTVEEAHAVVLSGGSAFGLAAASGVQDWLARRGVGFPVGSARVPIVPQAILFDLLNGGDKSALAPAMYEAMARAACDAAGADFSIGTAGAGFGASCASLRGGLGSASERLDGGVVVGALAAVNPLGDVTVGGSRHFWAAPFEQAGEYGGHGAKPHLSADDLRPRLKRAALARANTTLAVVATNARLSKREAHRLAVMAQTGLARAIYPVHTPLDGDVVFALATGDVALAEPYRDLAVVGTAAANSLARAVARAVFEAAPVPEAWQGPPSYHEVFP